MGFTPKRKPLFKGIRDFALLRFLSQAISLSFTLLTARILSPEIYGLAAIAFVVSDSARMLADLGIGVTIIQKPKINKGHLDNFFCISVLLGLFTFSVAFLLSDIIAVFFEDLRLVRIIQVTSTAFVIFSATLVPYNLLNRNMDFRSRGKINLIVAILSSTGQVLLAYLGFGVWALIYSFLASKTIILILSLYFSRYRPSFRLSWTLLRPDLNFAFQNTIVRFLFLAREKFVVVLLGKFLSVTQVGYYNFSETLAEIPNTKLVYLLREILLPHLAQNKATRDERLSSLATSLRFLAICILPLYLTGTYFADPIIPLLFGAKWEGAVPVFRILCLVLAIETLTSLVSSFNVSESKPKWNIALETAKFILIPVLLFQVKGEGAPTVVMALFFVIAISTLAWMIVLFRNDLKFLGIVAYWNFESVAICLGAFLVDYFLTNSLDISVSIFSIILRCALFTTLFAIYAKFRHLEFIREITKS